MSEEEKNKKEEHRTRRKMSAAKKKKMKLISSLIFLVALTAMVISLFLSYSDLTKMSATFQGILDGTNWVYLFVAIILVLGYFLLWPVPMQIIGKAIKIEATPVETYLIGCSEHFYNGVTPFAAGGQPFQIYALTNRNVPSSKATGLILMNYIIFITVTNIFAIASMAYYRYFIRGLESMNLSWLQWIAVLGFVLNVLNLVTCLLLAYSKWVKNFIITLFKWVCKIKFINKWFGGYLQKFEEYCENTQAAVKMLNEHKKSTFFSFLVRFIDMFLYYSIPFFLLKAVDLPIDGSSFFLCLFGASFAITAVGWMPTPGATGGIEYSFSIVIASVLEGTLDMSSANAVSLLWRLLTFYFILIISFICTAWLEGLISHRLKKEAKALDDAADKDMSTTELQLGKIATAKAESEKQEAEGPEDKLEKLAAPLPIVEDTPAVSSAPEAKKEDNSDGKQ